MDFVSYFPSHIVNNHVFYVCPVFFLKGDAETCNSYAYKVSSLDPRGGLLV